MSPKTPRRPCAPSVVCHFILVGIWALWLPNTVHSHDFDRLSASERTSLEAIASSKRFAALALFYIYSAHSTADSGTFYFDEVPTQATILALIEMKNKSTTDNFYPVQPSLYSATEFLVEIRWSKHIVSSGITIVSTSTQIVDRTGEPLRPSHVLEPVTNVLLLNDTFRLIEPSLGS